MSRSRLESHFSISHHDNDLQKLIIIIIIHTPWPAGRTGCHGVLPVCMIRTMIYTREYHKKLYDTCFEERVFIISESTTQYGIVR